MSYYVINGIHVVKGLPFPSSMLRSHLTLFAGDYDGSALVQYLYENNLGFEINKINSNIQNLDPGIQGRLAMVCEGGGKRRLFVIGNYVRQRLLRPFHDWAMKVFKTLPQDGTYDQSRPIRAVGWEC